jgi:hypothetical protein
VYIYIIDVAIFLLIKVKVRKEPSHQMDDDLLMTLADDEYKRTVASDARLARLGVPFADEREGHVIALSNATAKGNRGGGGTGNGTAGPSTPTHADNAGGKGTSTGRGKGRAGNTYNNSTITHRHNNDGCFRYAYHPQFGNVIMGIRDGGRSSSSTKGKSISGKGGNASNSGRASNNDNDITNASEAKTETGTTEGLDDETMLSDMYRERMLGYEELSFLHPMDSESD